MATQVFKLYKLVLAFLCHDVQAITPWGPLFRNVRVIPGSPVSQVVASIVGASVSAHLRVLDIAKNNINHRVQLYSAAASPFLAPSTCF